MIFDAHPNIPPPPLILHFNIIVFDVVPQYPHQLYPFRRGHAEQRGGDQGGAAEPAARLRQEA